MDPSEAFLDGGVEGGKVGNPQLPGQGGGGEVS